ncbi:MAG: hypothetical protein IJI47_03005 [Eubacterium sp.]|nr:hypothetical protein [Eubacterium sp.]
MKKKQKDIPQNVKNAFEEFFNAYYADNHEVKSLSFREMPDNEGYSAILTYKYFRQYVNYYREIYGGCAVNTCFEAELDGKVFLCHMVDVLNVLDSDDISFYTYPHCYTCEKINAALSEIMAATEKYYCAINNIMQSNGNKKQLWESVTAEEYEEPLEDDDISLPENTYDVYQLVYGVLSDVSELKRDLKKQAKRGKIDNAFEKRAARVLSVMDKREAKKITRKNAKARKLTTKEYFIMFLPYLIFIVLFAVPGWFFGMAADKAVYSGLFGRYHFEAELSGVALFIMLSTIPAWFVRKRIYKLILGDRWDNYVAFDDEQQMGTGLNLFFGALMLGLAAFFFMIGFSGIAFSQSGEIVYRDFEIHPQVYELSKTPIAIVKEDTENSEYKDTAYAFKLDGEWVEYGIPADAEAKAIIEKAVSEKESPPKTYQSIYDIDT